MHYANTEQITKPKKYVYKQPTYAKSTTDPTFYEPAATRIANMRRAAGVQYEGLYDFYDKDSISKFNESNFEKNISDAIPDIRFQKGLTQEEISQVTTNLSHEVENMISKKQKDQEKKISRQKEAMETQQIIDNSTTQNNSTE